MTREGGVVVAKPLSRVSWKRFAGGERRRWMDGWLCAFPCQYVDKSFWRDVGRREVFSVTSRHGGPKGNENDAFRRPFVAYPLYIYIYIYSFVPFCSFLSFFFISILILPRFAAFLFSFSISRPTDPPFSLRSTRGKLTATLIPLLFSFFFLFRNLAGEIYRCIRNKGEINCGVKVGNCSRFVVTEIVKRESFDWETLEGRF